MSGHCAITHRAFGTAQLRVVIMAPREQRMPNGGSKWELREVAQADKIVFYTLMSRRIGLRPDQVPGMERDGREYRFHLQTFVERLIAREPGKVEALRLAMPWLKQHIVAACNCVTSADDRPRFTIGSLGIARVVGD